MDENSQLIQLKFLNFNEILNYLKTVMAELALPNGAVIIAIDAPLSLPGDKTCWRQCDRKLLKMKIPCFPPTVPFFIGITQKGIRLKQNLEDLGFEVIEVYPYASRVRLNIAINTKKHTFQGRQKIQSALTKLIRGLPNPHPKPLTSHQLDAIICAYTAYLYHKAQAEPIAGKNGTIFIPKTKSSARNPPM